MKTGGSVPEVVSPVGDVIATDEDAAPLTEERPHGWSRARLVLLDFCFAVVLAVFLLTLATPLRSAEGVTIIYLAAGIGAGILTLLPAWRWPPYLLVVLMGQVVYYVSFAQLSPPIVVTRALADVAAILAYTLIVRAHRKPEAGLGVELPLAIGAAILAAAIRMVPVVALQLFGDPETARAQQAVWLQAPLSTVIGLIVASSVVFGLARWRETLPWRGRHFLLRAALAAATMAAVVAVFLTPLGSALPGAEYFIVALLLGVAAILPFPWVALINGISTVAIAASAAQGIGAFHSRALVTTPEVLDAQAYLLVVTVSVFILSANIEHRRAAQRGARRAADVRRQMFERSPVPSAWVSVEGDGRILVREGNAALAALLEAPETELSGCHLDRLATCDRGLLTLDVLEAGDLHLTLRQGKTVWVRPSLADLSSGHAGDLDLPDDNGTDTILTLRDTTAAHTYAELTRRQYMVDQLTGTYTRSALVDRLERQLAVGGAAQLGAVLVNIDNLRGINDAFGYATGDQVLAQLAQRIRTTAGDACFVARVGGDEFAILMTGSEAEADTLAERILDEVRKPLSLAGVDLVVTASAGVAGCGSQDRSETDVLRRADAALAEVKAGGRNRIGHVAPDSSPDTSVRFEAEAQLRSALDERALVCHFQPIIDLTSGEVVELESLVRLRAHDGGLVPPMLFIPLAGQLGLMDQLTEQVADEAARTLARWRADGHDVRVGVNAPPSWITPDAATYLAGLARDHHLPAGTITVEITEDEIPDLDEGQRAVLAQLSRQGVRLAVDDFGTGYAGLSSLLSVPSDVVKIDRSFVAALLESDDDRNLVQSIIDLIDHLGKVSIAEGIETAEQYRALRDMGCKLGQGFFMGRPVPADEVRLTRFRLPDDGAGRAP